MIVRTVIADDEPWALEKLRRFLAVDARVALVGTAQDGVEAVAAIERLRPGLVFLDVQMPGLDGFDVIDALQLDRLPHIVFVTAYDQYAVRAFELGAVDYLLKPVDGDRFAIALDRVLHPARHSTDLRHVMGALDYPRRYLRHFLVHQGGRTVIVHVDHVERIKTAGNYLKLYAAGQVHLVRGTMSRVVQRLDPTRFIRIHRSTIVNLDHVSHLIRRSHGDRTVVLRSGAAVILSRRYASRLRALGTQWHRSDGLPAV